MGESYISARTTNLIKIAYSPFSTVQVVCRFTVLIWNLNCYFSFFFFFCMLGGGWAVPFHLHTYCLLYALMHALSHDRLRRNYYIIFNQFLCFQLPFSIFVPFKNQLLSRFHCFISSLFSSQPDLFYPYLSTSQFLMGLGSTGCERL